MKNTMSHNKTPFLPSSSRSERIEGPIAFVSLDTPQAATREERSGGVSAALLIAVSLMLAACSQGDGSTLTTPVVPTTPDGGCSGKVAGHKNAYFGDLHVHTSDSFDAYFFNSLNGPREAYRFAKGEAEGLPTGETDPDTAGRMVQLDRPLDFTAVTDHAEYLGDFRTICQAQGNVPAGTNPACNIIGQNTRNNINALVNGDTPFATKLILAGLTELPLPRFAWQNQIAITDEEYQPCTFTTLHGYEYSSQKTGQMLHRNVLFLGDNLPADVFGSEQITDVLIENNTNDEWRLFDNLKQTCVVTDGCQVLTIPHSLNLSDGRMFLPPDPVTGIPLGRNGDPLTRDDAQLRATMDRALEIHQHKGNSECAVGLEGSYLQGEEGSCTFELNKSVCSGLPDDPASCKKFCTGNAQTDPAFCGFHQAPTFAVSVCQTAGPNGASGPTENCTTPLDMARNALAEGLRVKQELGGINPYRQAFIGSSDTHNGVPGNVKEDGWPGHGGVLDNLPRSQLGYWTCDQSSQDPADPASCTNRRFLDRGRAFNPGGVAGVWAEQNTREDIWNAVHRGETFATSGPRMRIRSFASWNKLPSNICERLASGDDLIAQGLVGARMGGDLPPKPAGAGAPQIAVWAMQDAGGNEPGAPLQRLDLVKGWLDAGGQPKVRVFDAIAKTADTVELPSQDCSVHASRHPEQLCAVWSDPDFASARDAFYYARAFEVPSCRWSEHLCASKSVDCARLDPANGIFPEASGLQGFEGCCSIQGAPGSFRGARTFNTIEERAWASPIWYDASAKN
jgi:hypothetical protein